MSLPIYYSSPLFGSQDASKVSLCGNKAGQSPADEIPALAGTLVRLELLLEPQAADLEAVTSLVRSDLGLTIQALRHSRSGALEDDGPWRISDCVVNLGERLIDIAQPLRYQPDNRDQSYLEVEAFWKYSELVATVAEQTAAYFGELDVNPEQAYIAGLLHKIERLPKVLNLAGPSNPEDAPFDLQEWVVDCNLPPFITGGLAKDDDGCEPYEMSALSRVVNFARFWIDMCLPWSETCLARRSRFNLPVLRAVNLIYRFFPGTEADPLVPFIEILKNSTLGKLDEQRPESSSILQGVHKAVPTLILPTHGNNPADAGIGTHSFEQA
jgi:hypothetical protein